MCHAAVYEWVISRLRTEDIRGRRILEVGSRYFNGSVRPLIERLAPVASYTGVDIEPGLCVDRVVPAEELLVTFGEGAFDTVVSTEMLEHVQDAWTVVRNLKGVLAEGGAIYLTTRSKGMPYHAHPRDFWRFEIDDLRSLFGDFSELGIERDPEAPGAFLRARKPPGYRAPPPSNPPLYSMTLGRRTADPSAVAEIPFTRRVRIALVPLVAKAMQGVNVVIPK